jgi:hypothetical protein
LIVESACENGVQKYFELCRKKLTFASVVLAANCAQALQAAAALLFV